MFSNWIDFSSDIMLANFQAQRVIALRLAKMARGGSSAKQEAELMVAEKVNAAAEAALSLATGKPPRSIVRRYRTIMRANERRLLRQS
jgi:hypothetical protein